MIPKILHQIWIGPLPPPMKMMNTWKEKNPDFEYIFWNETEMSVRNMTFRCQKQIDDMPEYNGKADIMRWEILNKYGGYFVDADSICIEPFDDYFINKLGFATFENETVRKDLIATGTMGFIPNHHLCEDIIEWILSEDAVELLQKARAWVSVGPGLLTRFLQTGKYPDFTVYPSYCFLPTHFTGNYYTGHKKVYAYQAWGTANESYDKMDKIELPPYLREPKFWVSVLIPSYNTKPLYIKECLESIRQQKGHFGIELVWINDGSSSEYSAYLEEELNVFIKRSRFCKMIYHVNPENRGVAHSLNLGVSLCSNELIFRMDSDDIMLPDRIVKQIEFMKKNRDCVICGTNMQLFTNDDPNNIRKKTLLDDTFHVISLNWQDFLRSRPTWFMNHPTLCFRRSAVLAVGNYLDRGKDFILEDYELELKLMYKFGKINNLGDTLLYYRVHPDQITYKKDSETAEFSKKRAQIVDDILNPRPTEQEMDYFDDW
jgi:glycosyltransferase involved in cell wall biosynthesis